MQTIFNIYSNIKNTHLKSVILGILLCSLSNIAFSQGQTEQLLSSISEKLKAPIADSVQLYNDLHRARLLSEKKETKQLASSYKNLATWHMGNPTIDSTLHYLDKVAHIYSEQNDSIQLAHTYLEYEEAFKLNTKYDKATQYAFKALEIYEAKENTSGIAEGFLRLSDLFSYKSDYTKGVAYAQKAIDLLSNTTEYEQLAKSYQYIASNELFDFKNEEALVHINKAIAILDTHEIEGMRLLSCRNTRGNILKYLERYDDAISDYTYNLNAATKINDTRLIIASNGNLGHIHIIRKEYEKAIPYLLKAIDLIKKSGNTVNLWENYMHASLAYENLGNFKQALEFERLLGDENKLYYKTIIARQEGELEVKYETTKKDETIEEQGATISRQRKIQLLYIGIGLLLAILLIGMYFTIKNNRRKRNKLTGLNHALKEQQIAIEASNTKLKDSLQELKETQAQLIQSEKMASLGELTAGIAHEIQNPLNFVNNFSEVSNELIDEMNAEIDKKNMEEVKLIAADIKQNLKKINHHGNRADAIVKGMLQHSRSNTGIKEATNINKLADEYLRLAYHGLRAKDKSFNATLETDFDESIGTLDVIPQDLGRVILNLITNAFYATNEKKQHFQGEPVEDRKDFKPTVFVSTKKENNSISISVKDNGNGIPKEVLNKIFQPFFTTKPTGQGTGLGLSMSYDIVRAHGGDLQVETKEGEGTTFTINLPKQ